MDLLSKLTQNTTGPVLAAELRTMVQALQQQVTEQGQQLSASHQTLACQKQTIQTLELKNLKLAHELAYLKRMRYGVKSEALTDEQRNLFEDDADQDLAAVEAEIEAPVANTPARKPRSRAGRQPLPEHLERIEVRHELENCTCGQCNSPLVKIGEDISEQLDIEPARFFVIQHIRPQYACRCCETVQAAPVEPAVIDGGMAAPGLLAWVAISKYLDHLPLYRLEQIAARQQVPLARSTLSEWIGRLGVALQPLSDRLAEKLRERHSLHADETPVQQLDPGKGKTKRAYLWAYRSNDLDDDPPIVVFDYQTSRSGQHARNFLEGWKGHLMVDDYVAYKAMMGSAIIEQACLAHARRKFFDLQAVGNHPVATEALIRIGRLYAIEADARGCSPPKRAQLRAERAQPELQSLHDWLLALRPGVANGSGLSKAIDYMLRRWPAFARYAATGDLAIDNNAVENSIRPIAIGKKNWLFAGSERAGKRAAAIQSLLTTAKLNGLDPAAWLKDTIEKLPSWPNRLIDELLPLRRAPTE